MENFLNKSAGEVAGRAIGAAREAFDGLISRLCSRLGLDAQNDRPLALKLVIAATPDPTDIAAATVRLRAVIQDHMTAKLAAEVVATVKG